MRYYSFLDQCLIEVQHFIKSVFLPIEESILSNPAHDIRNPQLSPKDSCHASGLIRINHAGEVCAQALYRGQAFVAKDYKTRRYLFHAAKEEQKHLAWCKERLIELNANESILTPAWYIGSFFIGAAVGLISDKVSYSFVIATEKQVMRHIEKHLDRLPHQDNKSRIILIQMYKDEQSHANKARIFGGHDLPLWVEIIMKAHSKIMTNLSYRI